MIAVALYHSAEIGGPPAVEQGGVVEWCLGLAPAVECLVDYQQAYAVAGVEKCRCGRIVRRAHGIEAGLLEQGGLAVLGIVVGCGSENAVVVVYAGA